MRVGTAAGCAGCGPILGVILAIMMVSSVMAADLSHPCARMREDADRLACYDAAFGRPARTMEAIPAPAPIAVPSGEQFGFTPQKLERDAAREGATSKQLAAITSEVSAVEQLRNGRFVATLANGQVWIQSETESRATVKAGDAVIIRRAALGSYLLTTKAGIATRVRRVK